MGYAYYTLPDGREAGYSVEATCDKPGCDAKIDRGLGYLCGREPGGDEFGCGDYFCEDHNYDHECPVPDPDEQAWLTEDDEPDLDGREPTVDEVLNADEPEGIRRG